MQTAIGKILFKNIHLNKSQIPQFRGAISGQFNQFDLLHNHHPDGRVIYRYPAVQFKIENNTPLIYAVGQEAINVFKPIFMNLDEISIGSQKQPVFEKEFSITNHETGIAGEPIVYRFMSPWLALNQENYQKYHALTNSDDKSKMLSSILINNIIAFSKYIGYTIPVALNAAVKLKPVQVTLKGEKLIGFTGVFKVNFLMPELIGLGKSTSRGFGVVEKVI